MCMHMSLCVCSHNCQLWIVLHLIEMVCLTDTKTVDSDNLANHCAPQLFLPLANQTWVMGYAFIWPSCMADGDSSQISCLHEVGGHLIK